MLHHLNLLYIDENRNNNCEIPQNEQKKRRVNEILPLVLKNHFKTDGKFPLDHFSAIFQIINFL